MRLIHAVIVTALLHGSVALGQTILVHPFGDEGSLVGTVIADRVAEALTPLADLVLGPATAPASVPPFAYQEGYVSPLALLDENGPFEAHGAVLLRDASGADLVVTGQFSSGAGGLTLDVVLAARDATPTRITLEAATGEAGYLAQQLAGLIAFRLELGRPAPVDPIGLSGSDDVLARVATLLAGGFPGEAVGLIQQAAAQDLITPRLALYRDALQAVQDGRAFPDAPAIAALAALALLQDDTRTQAYFRQLADAGLPSALVWLGALAEDGGDLPAADAAYAQAESTFPYGAAAAMAYRASQGEALLGLDELLTSGDSAALLTVSLVTELAGDVDPYRTSLQRLSEVLPTFTWPFERLSYLAFDEEDALAAAEALIVATRLDPNSDLYWTNLGWAWYLLGFWDRSEVASVRAIEISADAFIASYNLGLVRARFGRLDEAMPPYEQALARDPEVDDEALFDVENAIGEVPDEPALRYVLGRLYEAEGRRAEAADAYQAFLDLGGFGAPYDAAAERRIAALTAPLPPIEIVDGVITPLLGTQAAPTPLHPGDPLNLEFELYTPGDALPARIDVTSRVLSESGEELVVIVQTIEIPDNAIGYVVQEPQVTLPDDLAAGAYVLAIEVDSRGGPSVTAESAIEISGAPSPLRQLVGRNVVLTSLAGSRPLYDLGDVDTPTSVINAMIAELRSAIEAAEANLPRIEGGRFDGLTGGPLFENSTAEDVEAFLAYLADDGARDFRVAFVDAYAQWALEGGVTPE